jgi:SWI/SNF-related matrix-associated actin-dependent regulator 1 of chromatin subfamily A
MDNTLKLSFDGLYFTLNVTPASSDLARERGFKFNPIEKIWFTDNLEVASRLRHLADDKAKKELSRFIAEGSPWAGSISHPPHLKPFDFQIRAAKWALSRPKSYMGLEAGLGKTIVACLIYNSTKERIIYICPPFLLGNVANEFRKWCGVEVTRFDELLTDKWKDKDIEVVLIPDSIIYRIPTLKIISKLSKLFGAIIVDEAHRFKSKDAKRTKALFSISRKFKRQIFMSGTPMPNRPLELYPVLKVTAPHTIGHRNGFQYGVRYCNGFQDEFGWDFTGASNMKELSTNIKKDFMLRIKKDEVLKELPPKIETLVMFDEKMPKELNGLEKQILHDNTVDDLQTIIGDTHLSTYLRELGAAKVKPASKIIRDVLDSSGESVLVFGVHKEAIRLLGEELKAFDPLIITGSVDKDERFKRAELFQSDKSRRLMILNIQAGGVGFNLTKATRVIFLETTWVPADLDQAADRAHRIGQKDFVNVWYLCFRDSLDSIMLSRVLDKRKVTGHV